MRSAGPPSSTGNIEQGLAGRKVEPAQKPVLLVCGEPTILSNVLPKGFATDLLIQVRLEIVVVGVVLTLANAQLGFRSSVHPNLHCAGLARTIRERISAWRHRESFRADGLPLRPLILKVTSAETCAYTCALLRKR